MKTRTLILVFLIMAVLIIAGSCAKRNKSNVAKPNNEQWGTWVNFDYDVRSGVRAIRIYNPVSRIC